MQTGGRRSIERGPTPRTAEIKTRSVSLRISLRGSFPDFITFTFVHLAGLNLSNATYIGLMVYIFNLFVHPLGYVGIKPLVLLVLNSTLLEYYKI